MTTKQSFIWSFTILFFLFCASCSLFRNSRHKSAALIVEAPKPPPKPEPKPEPKPMTKPPLDSDKDGVPDYSDQSPNVPGTLSNNGSPEVGSAASSPANLHGGSGSINHQSEQPTAAAPDKEEIKPASATLGYSYSKKMKLEDTKDLRVTVRIDGTAAQVRKQIRTIENMELGIIPKKDTSTIGIVQNITAYKTLEISLQYDKADFTITPVETEERQELDFVNGNNWHWTVRALGEKSRTAKVILKIFAEGTDGKKSKPFIKNVDIEILIDDPKTPVDKVLEWIGKNIMPLLSILIIPLVIFLYNKRKKKEDPTGK